MEKFSELAFNIINNLLKIQKHDVISISGEIHNANNANEPLIELPLIEELAVAIRKTKSIPCFRDVYRKTEKTFFCRNA